MKSEPPATITPSAPVCHCVFAHPTTVEAAAEVLERVDDALRVNDARGVYVHLIRLFGPCPAATARAQALADVQGLMSKG
ncbi:hypothetical protein ACH4VR_36110 [Streptomyces sp. NPDC020883]|uniref:hypothetical protein n=1 Tax=Streptomyces sp. NPDC020883 TaxID=3365099 RepID=UPI00378CF7A9